MKDWIETLQSCSNNCKLVIFGNKLDLEKERAITYDRAKIFAEERGIYFTEVSAKTNLNNCVHKGFEYLLL